MNQPFGNHKGGQIAFGPDGFLYIALGDGGSGGDPQGNGQNLQTMLGKVLRIDVDHMGSGQQYAIPSGNPFAGGGGLPEIWAYGFRNPFRFSFDRRYRTAVLSGTWARTNMRRSTSCKVAAISAGT